MIEEIDAGLWLWDGLEEAKARRQTLQSHLAGLLHCPEAALKIVRDELGRPVIEEPATSIQFSQARRDGMVALAVSEQGAVGVDVEVPNDGPWQNTVAGDFFAPYERRWLSSLKDEERGDAFFRLWTGKEAVLKALGLGIAQGMAEPDFSDIMELRRPMTADHASVTAFGRRFHLKWWFPQMQSIPMVLCKAVEDP
jgi:4'-phosphopantetheinyl transferase